MRLIVWPIIIGVMGIGIYALWRDLAAGHYLKVLLIGPFAAFVGVRAYWQAKQAARS